MPFVLHIINKGIVLSTDFCFPNSVEKPVALTTISRNKLTTVSRSYLFVVKISMKIVVEPGKCGQAIRLLQYEY
jgi:hypothetical protein